MFDVQGFFSNRPRPLFLPGPALPGTPEVDDQKVPATAGCSLGVTWTVSSTRCQWTDPMLQREGGGEGRKVTEGAPYVLPYCIYHMTAKCHATLTRIERLNRNNLSKKGS